MKQPRILDTSTPAPWVDIHVLLTERRDELKRARAGETRDDERLRIDGAVREITWLLEQVQERWAEWGSRQGR